MDEKVCKICSEELTEKNAFTYSNYLCDNCYINELWVELDGEFYAINKVNSYGYGYLPSAKFDDRTEWVFAKSSEQAGDAVAENWRNMAEHDRDEFIAMMGEERLVQWALGASDNFGISSLDEFFEKVAENPEEDIASYDGSEVEVTEYSVAILEKFGFHPRVAYRTN